MSAAFVGEELPCQGVHTNSEDPFVVAVEKGKTMLIVGHMFQETFPQSARCFYNEAHRFSVE